MTQTVQPLSQNEVDSLGRVFIRQHMTRRAYLAFRRFLTTIRVEKGMGICSLFPGKLPIWHAPTFRR